MKRTKHHSSDLFDRLYPPEQRLRSSAMAVLLGALATIYFLLLTPVVDSLKDEDDIAFVRPSQFGNQPNPPYRPFAQESTTESSPKTVDLALRRGDTLQGTLLRHGLTPTSAKDLIKQLQPFYNTRKMRDGDTFRLLLDHDNGIQGLEHSANGTIVRVMSTQNGWIAKRHEVPFISASKVVRGNIRGSLFEDGVDAGLSPPHIHQLVNLFEYDIDFFSDLRRGDGFSVILEDKQYANGQREEGKLLAAEIQAGGSPYQIFYYQGRKQKGSYYDNRGQALMKAFLRAPLNYRRISSSFRINRRHPIFRTVRPHQAIDYAAPTGTPVVAVGDGEVTFSGTRGGYGQMVEIRHNDGYVSRYAHFSKIPKEIRVGKSISRGEVVGYVGQTGHATGPHLHFEMLNKGRKINFLDLKLASADRLTGSDLQEFFAMRDRKLALLQGSVAAVSENPHS
ncbi:MAG TPA: peptidoglycan DD-metalloendopeptidase family protein [Candidatus Polarisedimenticolaceae bacterium]|nr:peptidoglycan DD-metalloendopeptidase family protein [Candidatus Polarisedimenticolaceae bacterium]